MADFRTFGTHLGVFTQSGKEAGTLDGKFKSASTNGSARLLPSAATHCTLADLYDPLTMPATLAKAHAELDRAVERCYRAEPFRSDRERVEHLFALYEKLTTLFLTPKTKTRTRRAASAPSPRPRRGRTPGLPEAGAR